MKDIIARQCSAMKFAITEYNFGDQSLWSAAITTAEALAIFGREGVDLATIWVVPGVGTPVENAFKLFLNYDGANSNVFGSSVQALSTNTQVPAYSILSTDNSKLFVFVFNKQSAAANVVVSLKNVVPSGASATKYFFKQGSNLASGGTLSITGNQVTTTLGTWEAALIVVPVSSVGQRIAGDSDGTMSGAWIGVIVTAVVASLLIVLAIGLLIKREITGTATFSVVDRDYDPLQ